MFLRREPASFSIKTRNRFPAIADAILGHIFDFYYEHHRRIFEAGQGRIDLTWVAEDLGSQTGPLMSLATYRRFLLPNQIRMADLARVLNCSRRVVERMRSAGRLPAPDLHIGKMPRWRPETIREWLEGGDRR